MVVEFGNKPKLLDRPKEFAAVMYKGNWFYVADDDYPSKDVLSGVIGIFTMMPVGKPATAPVLTLPVR